MKPQPLTKLLKWIKKEYGSRESIFGVRRSTFLNHAPGAPYASNLFGEYLASPIGPAAGPNTQLAQNIIAGWLCGARFIELKTVQIMDELEIPRPCIDMEDEGYNVEWSQELKLEESVREYAKAWALIPIIRKMLGWEGPDGTIFNMSVGYNLEGILEPRMQSFMDAMLDAGEIMDEYREELSEHFPEFADVQVSNRISGSCTLSTMHGCPPDEVGRIAQYLLGDRGFHLSVKLNPTLMGPDFVRGTLRDSLGYSGAEIPDSVFEHDMKFPQAVEIIKSMKELSALKGRYFGVKLSNTLAMRNTRGALPGGETYMSGRSLYPITMNLWNRLNKEFGGDLRVSYSAGADALNSPTLLMCGASSVTVASDILKPGGYSRFPQYIRNIEREMSLRGASSLAEFASLKDLVLESAAKSALGEKKYMKGYFRGAPKARSPLGKFDCIEAPCMERCAVCQDVPSYALAISRGDYDRALGIILAKNPLPGVTGHVCTRLCESACTRANYDEPVGIRALKRFASERGFARKPQPSKATGHKAAVIGAGPSGLAAAAIMAQSGIAVTVFEARERAGGMMAIAPEFRLPKEVMDRDVERIVSLGVDIKYGVKVSKPPESLLEEGFDAVYVSCGFPKDAPLGIEGDGSPGVWTALDLLERVSRGERPDLGGKALVVGGGNTAVDAARTAMRLTGSPVTVVYRRTRSEMPAELDELEILFEEGSELVELAAPNRVVLRDERVCGLECERTLLGAPDADGRRRPRRTGEFFVLEADSIIAAIGQSSDMAVFAGTKIDLAAKGAIGCAANGRTSVCGVYAGGDAVTGPATVIGACADGRRAAEAICRELSVPAPEGMCAIEPTGDELARVLEARTCKAAPEFEGRIDPESRRGFELVERTLDEESAVREAKRCLQCGSVCRKCVEVCPNRANYSYEIAPVTVTLPTFTVSEGTLRSLGQEAFSVRQGDQVAHIEDFCNECGNCAVFCVHPGRPYEDKPRLCLDDAGFASSRGNDVFKVESGKIRRRVGGKEESLSVSDAGYLYETEDLKIEMDRGFSAISAEFRGSANHSEPISIAGALEMWVLYSGVENSMPWLMAY